MNAFLITNYDKQRWVETWIKIIRNFSETYFICVVDNGGHQFPEADLSLNISRAKPYTMGDVQLMNAGMVELCKLEDVEYIIKTSADTWMFEEERIAKLIRGLKVYQKDFLSSHWNHQNDIATDFFIISRQFAKEFFPFNYDIKKSLPENYLGVTLDRNKFFYWKERDPIHDSQFHRKMIWEDLSFVTSHNYEENLQTVLKLRPELKGLIEAE